MKVNIFIAYSHTDKRYLKENSLLGHLQDLVHDGIAEFWSDERITTGNLWDEEIKQKINESQIALVLVSDLFLTSNYVRNTEIPHFIKKRREDGMIIFPIILSACEWRRYEWLSTTQFLPRDGKTVRELARAGKSEELFVTVKRDLRDQVEAILKKTTPPSGPEGPGSSAPGSTSSHDPTAPDAPQDASNRVSDAVQPRAPRDSIQGGTPQQPPRIWINPFQEVTGNDLPYEDMPQLFVGEYTPFNAVTKRFDTILEGQRGTGKTMILRYMACETQLKVWTDELHKEPVEFFKERQNYVGIYCRLEQGVFDKSDLDAVQSGDRRNLLFEHRLSLVCLSSILETLTCMVPIVHVSDAAWASIKKRLATLLDEPRIEDSADWEDVSRFAQDTIDIRVSAFDTHLGSLQPGSEPIPFNPHLTLSGQTVPFLTFLQAQLGIKCPFFLMLDDFDVLRASQQEVVFRTAAARKLSVVCFKYGIMTFGKKAMLSGAERTYRSGDDYDAVSLDWTDNGLKTDYAKAVGQITQRRLSLANWPTGLDFSRTLIPWGRGETIRREVREAARAEYEKLPEKRRPDTFDSYWSKYGNARYFQELARRGTRHLYSGYDTVIDVSSGIYRQYLEVCAEIVAKAFANGWRPDTRQPIRPVIQNDCIRDYSHDMLESLVVTAGDSSALLSGNIRITSKHMTTFVNSLAGLFKRRLLSTSREPEIFSIAIRDQLENNPEARALLDVATRESLLHKRAIGYPPKTGGGARLPTYMLNRRLLPAWDLGLRMQGRIELTAEDVVLAANDTQAFVTKFTKIQSHKGNGPQQLGLDLTTEEN